MSTVDIGKSDTHPVSGLLSLAPEVHSNAQMRAIHARITEKKKAQQSEGSSRYTQEWRDNVGGAYSNNWGG